MDITTIVKGLKTHVDNNTDCFNCPFKDEVNCVDHLMEAAINKLEGIYNEISR